MSTKTKRKTRQTELPSQIQPGAGAAAISLENPMARPEFRMPALIEKGIAALTQAWSWYQQRTKAQRKTRKLRVCESVQLGDKRFVALIQADGQRFLIGGTSSSVSVLATLPSRKNFRSLLPKDASFEVQEQ
jgi:hypothetical protein